MLIPLRHKKNTALTLVFPLADSDGQPITGAAGLDSEKSQDGGSFADCTNEAAEIGVTGWYALTLTAAELNYGVISVRVQTSTSGIMPLAFMITTYTEPLDDANSELAAIPTTTGGLRSMVQFLFEYFRNKRTATADTETLYKEDASTPLGTSTLSDDGTTFTKGELS
jgi:hypothetical protein